MATYYLARYSASTAHLRDVLARKVRRRCATRDLPVPDEAELTRLLDDVIGRLAQAALIDDAAFGRGRAAALARKGWPAWRIRAELERQGVTPEAEGLAEVLPADETAQARRLAERRRLGPFRPRDRDGHREKDIASLARAGFPVAVARTVIDGEA